jgi:thioredoxin-related protein
MSRRKWLILVAALCAVSLASSGWAKSRLISRLSGTRSKNAPAAEPIQWQSDLQTARRAAVESGRPILIVVGGDRCTYCRKLEAETLGDPSVATYVNTSFIPVHLDCKKDRRATEILEVQALPTCVVLSPEADLLGTIEGFIRPPEFTNMLHQSLNYHRKLQKERAAGNVFDE